jgi:hypothetical protein
MIEGLRVLRNEDDMRKLVVEVFKDGECDRENLEECLDFSYEFDFSAEENDGFYPWRDGEIDCSYIKTIGDSWTLPCICYVHFEDCNKHSLFPCHDRFELIIEKSLDDLGLCIKPYENLRIREDISLSEEE